MYIGFGSIVVDNPRALTKTVIQAVQAAGVRAVISKGWSGIGPDGYEIPDHVFIVGDTPHDWLFDRVSAVVHHGGAGTTAAGIAAGKPTVIVPFFGDQPFWGSMVAQAGAGPEPIPFKMLTSNNLAETIKFALHPATLTKAQELGAPIKEEQGCEVGAQRFHDQLDIQRMRCQLAPSRVAVWRVKETDMKLSALAAAVLTTKGLLEISDLEL